MNELRAVISTRNNTDYSVPVTQAKAAALNLIRYRNPDAAPEIRYNTVYF
jgi:hypothetical protein